MADLTLRAIRAKNGDSLLLLADGARVLIDGGPSGVYESFLRDQLKALSGRDGSPPDIDLMMVSHIDGDHIDGILELTAEMLEDQQELRDPVVTIRRAWHNSFADVIAKGGGTTSAGAQSHSASLASALGDLPLEKDALHETKMVLSSVGDGRRLRLDLKALNIDVNRGFKDGIALLGGTSSPWTKGALSLDVIGPGQTQVDRLRNLWAKKLDKILAKEAEAETAARSMDTSVANLSSIVVVAEAGGKSALLTGDARGKMMLEWLEATGRLAPGGTVHFDIVKIPHHGSGRNVTSEFFERVTADHYVICGNGKHGNPEPGTLRMLFEARPELNYTIHMTYSLDDVRTHKDFVKRDYGPELDDVLSHAGRAEVFNFPAADETYIDIAV